MHAARRLVTRAVLGMAVAALAATFAAPATPAHAAEPVRLMIDPGHGGTDPGAVGNGLQEKDSSLKISRMIAQSAKRQGWKVDMTRYEDRFVGLRERPAKATAFKATTFVSVHSNSTGSKSLGNMTIYRGAASGRLGKSIMNELNRLTPYKDIGNSQDVRGLAVLRGSKQPAVLVELLSVSSRPESRSLKSPVKQREMAEAVVRGVARFHGVEYVPAVKPKAPAKPKPVRSATAAATPGTIPTPRSAATATPTVRAAAPTVTTAPVPKPATKVTTRAAETTKPPAATAPAPSVKAKPTRPEALSPAAWSIRRILSFLFG